MHSHFLEALMSHPSVVNVKFPLEIVIHIRQGVFTEMFSPDLAVLCPVFSYLLSSWTPLLCRNNSYIRQFIVVMRRENQNKITVGALLILLVRIR